MHIRTYTLHPTCMVAVCACGQHALSSTIKLYNEAVMHLGLAVHGLHSLVPPMCHNDYFETIIYIYIA